MTTTDETSCARCGNPRHRGRCKKAQGETTLADVVKKHAKKTRATRRPKPAPVVIEDSLEILPARGCRVSVENGFVVIEQDDALEDGAIQTHNITLTLNEFDRIAELRQRIGEAA